MESAVRLSRQVGAGWDEARARVLLYRAGEQGYRDALALAAARRHDTDEARLAHDLALPFRWQPPRMPVSGRDLVAAGLEKGPAIGAAIRAAEALWLASDFALDREALVSAVLPVTADAPSGS
jgi:poly(A) polymerase